jgi:hypothetical protein
MRTATLNVRRLDCQSVRARLGPCPTGRFSFLAGTSLGLVRGTASLLKISDVSSSLLVSRVVSRNPVSWAVRIVSLVFALGLHFRGWGRGICQWKRDRPRGGRTGPPHAAAATTDPRDGPRSSGPESEARRLLPTRDGGIKRDHSVGSADLRGGTTSQRSRRPCRSQASRLWREPWQSATEVPLRRASASLPTPATSASPPSIAAS